MGSPEEAPPIAGRGRTAETTGEIEQAGRSDSSLNAEQNSAELRTDGSPSSGITSRAYAQTLVDTSSDGATTGSAERLSSSRSSERRASYAPNTPSPLNPSASTSSISTDGSQDNQTPDFPVRAGRPGERQRDQNRRGMQDGRTVPRRGSRPSSSLTPMQQLLREKSIPNTRAETPRNWEDLGRNYSRYPPSLVDSPRHSRSVEATRNSSAAYLLAPGSPLASSTLLSASSQAPLVGESEKWPSLDDMSTFNPYSGGEKGYILYANETEDDDDDHMPMDDDDAMFRTRFSDYFNRRVIVSTFGAMFLILGILTLFIVLPVIFFTGVVRMPLPEADYSYYYRPNDPPNIITWATVNNRTYPLLSNFRRGLIDPDTPANAMIRKSTFDDADLQLVFSDEFNQNNRTFYPGDDPYWTAPDFWYGATQDLDWYDPDAVTTYDGTLQLRLDRFPNHNLLYRSGMLNSWNQLCFKGGVFEVSLSLPGPAGVPGLWPGVWSMGNLGRPGYKATTEGLWPYTYNSCDAGITPNQSSPDGISHLPGQKLPSCTCAGEDHPNPGTGRGAPEIDILEASVDPTNLIGVVTQSFQVAPFDVYYRPNSEFMQIPNLNTTSMNGYCGGPFQQAISGTTLLNNEWYDGNSYQKYAFEYEPGTSDGKIAWFVGEDRSFMMDGRAIGQNGNVGPRVVSEEPMSLVLNLGFSNAWGLILVDQLKFPTVMKVDYVRIYQRKGQESITCDPPGFPTTEYIKNHMVAYTNPNLTAWNETGYAWPANKLNSGC